MEYKPKLLTFLKIYKWLVSTIEKRIRALQNVFLFKHWEHNFKTMTIYQTIYEF